MESKELSKEENLFLRNLRSNLSSEDAKEITEAYKEIKSFDEKNVYLDRLIQANQQAFKEAIILGEAAKALFLEVADEEGWFDEWGQKRDIEKAREIARGLKRDNIPLSVIVKNTKLSIQEVEAL